MHRIHGTSCLLTFLFLAGCAAPDPRAGYVTPRPLGAALPAARPGASETATQPAAPVMPTGDLTRADAQALALLHNPRLAAFSWDVRAADARRIQAGLFPNPELSIEIENVGGTLPGWKESETTASLGQLLELGGKRRARIRLAESERTLAGWDYETARLDVLTAVSRRFVELLGAQRRLELASLTLEIADRIRSAVTERVRAGAVSAVEQSKAEVEWLAARMERERAEREVLAARARLAAEWGESTASFARATGELDANVAVPPLSRLAALAGANPDLARWDAELEARERGVDLERARAVPDLLVEGGYRRIEESSDDTFVFGVRMPLPLFDRNQGGIRAAEAKLSRGREERRATEARVGAELAEAHAALSAAAYAARVLRDDVLPRARSVLEAVQAGYPAKFGNLELLDAQRTLAKTELQYVDALVALHTAKADIERLVGATLESISSEGE